jgi:hypothetical protein
MYDGLKNIHTGWNLHILKKYGGYHDVDIHTSYIHTYTTLPTLPTLPTSHNLYEKIDKSEIQGRNLELLLPLIFVASFVDSSDEFIDKIIKIAVEVTNERRHEEEVESFDVMMLKFISELPTGVNYYKIRVLTDKFKNDYDLIDKLDINPEWFGRALKRLNLIIDKKRKTSGIEVFVNIPKAREQSKMFEKAEFVAKVTNEVINQQKEVENNGNTI